ncbi:MAG TPA: DUF6111 family protein [Rhodopila sp.]
MSRIIEIVLFLTPFLAFATWRLVVPSPAPPPWLIYALAGAVALLLLGLLWTRHFDAGDANDAYVPAKLIGGRVVPAQRTP